MRKDFEHWLDSATKHQDARMPTPWKIWQAATLAEREACAKVCDDAVSSLAACPKSEKNEAAISALKQQACMIRSRSNAELCGGTSATNAVLNGKT